MTAGAARLRRDAVHGVLLLDKPGGMTSQSALARAKRLFNAAKAGHTGTLDPSATGLLPVAFGEATKFCGVLLDATKSYLALVRLGLVTTTGDLEGEVTARSAVEVDRARIESVLERFRGAIAQTPPMYSALKHEGKPLYRYAREGREIERSAREVMISTLDLRAYDSPDLTLAVTCSKGTYVRVLAEDIGRALGCGATLAALRRTHVGRFSVADAVGLDALEALAAEARRQKLLPVDAMIADLPALRLDSAQASRIANGRALALSADVALGLVRLFGPDGTFAGIGEALPGGVLEPRRLVANKASNG